MKKNSRGGRVLAYSARQDLVPGGRSEKLRRAAAWLAVLTVGLTVAAPAAARSKPAHYFPKAGHGCAAGYLKERPKVKERRDGRVVRHDGKVVRVRRTECFLKSKLRYKAKVDPSFVQSPTNPLAVTYAYSAAATAGGANLAAEGALPAGVLNFYSAQTPGGPESLFCSMNVGAAVTGGACPITYSQTGTYDVTTQYIPDAVSAVTETDVETINPFSTTTSLSVAETGCGTGSPPGYATVTGPYCGYTLTSSVVDQNANVVGSHVLLSVAPNTGEAPEGEDVPANGSCLTYVTASWVLSPDCNFEAGSGLYDASSWSLAAAFAGLAGWAASTSVAVTVAP